MKAVSCCESFKFQNLMLLTIIYCHEWLLEKYFGLYFPSKLNINIVFRFADKKE